MAHSLRHVRIAKKAQDEPLPTTQETQPPQLVITPNLLETLRGLLAQSQTTVSEEQTKTPLLLTQGQAQEGEEENNGERVKAYLADHPKATLREIAEALTIRVTTARKWRGRVQEGVQGSGSKAR